MILEPTISFLRKRPQHFAQWVGFRVPHAVVPEGFAETLAKVCIPLGINWPYLACSAAIRSRSFSVDLENNYWSAGKAKNLEEALEIACEAIKKNPDKFESLEAHQAVKDFILWSAKKVGQERGPKLPDVPSRPDPTEPIEPGKPTPLPPSVPPPPPPEPKEEEKPDAPFKLPGWVSFLFGGIIRTALLGLVTWLISMLPFLAPFKAWLVELANKLLELFL